MWYWHIYLMHDAHGWEMKIVKIRHYESHCSKPSHASDDGYCDHMCKSASRYLHLSHTSARKEEHDPSCTRISTIFYSRLHSISSNFASGMASETHERVRKQSFSYVLQPPLQPSLVQSFTCVIAQPPRIALFWWKLKSPCIQFACITTPPFLLPPNIFQRQSCVALKPSCVFFLE